MTKNKKKIIIFVHSYKGFMKIYIDQIIHSLLKKKYKIYLYYKKKIKIDNVEPIIQKDLMYLYKMRDPRIYEEFLLFAKKKGINILLIPRLEFPAFLNYSMMSVNFKYKIYITTMALELFKPSLTKLTIMKNILLDKKVQGLAIHTAANRHMKVPKKFAINNNLKKKIFFFSEPKYYLDNNFMNKKKYKLSNKFKILFFGNFFYGKGLDILVNASKYLNNNIKITIAGDPSSLNFSYNIKKKYKNINLLDKYISDNKMFELFKSTDAVVLPYRKSYCCLSSGVLINSVQAFKPVIVPDIYPFNEIIKKYKIGLKFKVEDVKNLAKSINYLHKLIQEKKFKNENFKKYLDEMNSTDLVIAKLNI